MMSERRTFGALEAVAPQPARPLQTHNNNNMSERYKPNRRQVCVVCEVNKAQHTGPVLHAFPKDKKRRHKWLEAVNIPVVLKKMLREYNIGYVCSLHFSEKNYVHTTSRYSLTNFACPDQNLADNAAETFDGMNIRDGIKIFYEDVSRLNPCQVSDLWFTASSSTSQPSPVSSRDTTESLALSTRLPLAKIGTKASLSPTVLPSTRPNLQTRTNSSLSSEDMDYTYFTTKGGCIKLKPAKRGYMKLKPGVTHQKFDYQGRNTAHKEMLQKKMKIQEIPVKEEKNQRDRDVAPILDAVEIRSNRSPKEQAGHSKSIEDSSTKNSCSQTRLIIGKRSKAGTQGNVVCNADVKQIKSEEPDADSTEKIDQCNDSLASSDNSYTNCDIFKNDVPSDSASIRENVNYSKVLLPENTRKVIKNHPEEYIGLERKHLNILGILSAHVSYHEKEHQILTQNAVMMVLMIIRRGVADDTIAEVFNISKSNMNCIVANVVPLMADCFKELSYCPSSDVIRSRHPNILPLYYKVESIIDCFEIQVEKPSSVMNKNCNSVKYLISVTLDGQINFVSSGKSGNCNDIEVLRGSGYLDCLMPGLTVVADQGFKGLEDDLKAKGCLLVSYESSDKEKQLPLQKRAVADLHLLVKKKIRGLQFYKILDTDSCIPFSMIDLLDDIVNIVCGLINKRSLYSKRK